MKSCCLPPKRCLQVTRVINCSDVHCLFNENCFDVSSDTHRFCMPSHTLWQKDLYLMALENQEMDLKIFCKSIIVTASFRSNFKVEMEGTEDQALLDRLVKQVIPGQLDRQVLLVSSSCKSTSRSKILPFRSFIRVGRTTNTKQI